MPTPPPSLLAEHPLGARIVGFGDHLRLNGFAVGPREAEDVMRQLAARPLPTLTLARQTLKSMLCGRREDWARFDALFEAYWQGDGRRRERLERTRETTDRLSASGRRLWETHLDERAGESRADIPRMETDDAGEVENGTEGRLVASAQTVRSRVDLRHVSDPGEIAEAERLAYRLASAMRERLSRRYRRDDRGSRLDLRRTIRANLAHGGEPLTLVRRARPDRPVRLVVFLDVSGSMQSYSRFFLQFVKGLVCRWIEADAYLVHTRLIRVTDVVREKDSIKAMTRLSLMADGFGGGTRLGASLRKFNDQYARRAVNQRTVAIVLSDGYDTDPPEMLAEQLARLKRRAPKLVWLNPLLGWRDYRPVTAAMVAARPHIDCFAAANTLESLAALEPELARL